MNRKVVCYEKNNKSCLFTGFSNLWGCCFCRADGDGCGGEAAVSVGIGGYHLQGVGDYAFLGLYADSSWPSYISIPNSVTNIGYHAFSYLDIQYLSAPKHLKEQFKEKQVFYCCSFWDGLDEAGDYDDDWVQSNLITFY